MDMSSNDRVFRRANQKAERSARSAAVLRVTAMARCCPSLRHDAPSITAHILQDPAQAGRGVSIRNDIAVDLFGALRSFSARLSRSFSSGSPAAL